jgi:hypothetical protein
LFCLQVPFHVCQGHPSAPAFFFLATVRRVILPSGPAFFSLATDAFFLPSSSPLTHAPRDGKRRSLSDVEAARLLGPLCLGSHAVCARPRRRRMPPSARARREARCAQPRHSSAGGAPSRRSWGSTTSTPTSAPAAPTPPHTEMEQTARELPTDDESIFYQLILHLINLQPR